MESLPEGGPDQKYASAYDFMCSLDRFGILLGLDNITALLHELGNPQTGFSSVHIGGSNGKGSTAAFLDAVLREAGLRTALYTSPHLNDFRERIRLNGRLVSKDEVLRSYESVKAVYDPARTTFFEFTTALAFDCIARARPDIAIVEVGLGGRLDATNTVAPLAVAITDISREHEEYLGTGIAAIAREKAGIIKEHVPVVSGAVRRDARRVIDETAATLDAPVHLFGRDFVGKRVSPLEMVYQSDMHRLTDLHPSLAGSHQAKNAALACALAEQLIAHGFTISERHIRDGLCTAAFPGRFEQVRRSPDVIIDGAHTAESLRLLKSTFRDRYPGVKPVLILGMLREKNFRLLTRVIAPMAREVVCVPAQGNRALDPETLAHEVRQAGVSAKACTTIESGLETALAKAGPDGVVLATGSLYMIGPVRLACGLPDE